ncbi:MAG: hypothetical protein IJP54_08095 [Synergistaceae bacterium]|nr:hypothetical protein [Synergistaceae bacterium]
MYEIHESLTEYFAELDPKRRLEILDSLSDGEGVDSGFLHELYHDRYSDHENRGRKNVDWWLWRCICLQQLYNKGGFFRKFRKREVNAILEELRTNDTDPQHRAYLYHEYRNTAGRYLSTCKSGNYASRFMGFRQASDDEKALRACGDIWEMSRGIARSEGVEERMQVWCEAFRDEVLEYDPVCREEYARLDSER